MPVLVIDNGASHLKVGFNPHLASGQSRTPEDNRWQYLAMPNAIAIAQSASGRKRVVGDQIEQLPHFHGVLVRRPMENGCIVDGQMQAVVWERVLTLLKVSSETKIDLVLTIAIGSPCEVFAVIHWLCFERFHFHSLTLVPPEACALLTNPKASSGVGVVIDAGFSATSVTSFIDWKVKLDATQRIPVGGKLLSNRLKELISFSQVNLLEDWWIANAIKEQVCRVALNFDEEMRLNGRLAQRHVAASESNTAYYVSRLAGKSPDAVGVGASGKIVLIPKTITTIHYILPTLPEVGPIGLQVQSNQPEDIKKWRRRNAQIITLTKEPFVVAETLFTPTDVGIRCAGVSECVLRAYRIIISTLCLGSEDDSIAKQLQSLLKELTVIAGGSAALPGFADRLNADMCAALPNGVDSTIPFLPKADQTTVLGAAKLLAKDGHRFSLPTVFPEETMPTGCDRGALLYKRFCESWIG